MKQDSKKDQEITMFVIDKLDNDGSDIKSNHMLYTEDSKIIDISNAQLATIYNDNKDYTNLVIEYTENKHNNFLQFIKVLNRKYSVELSACDERIVILIGRNLKLISSIFIHIQNFYDEKFALWNNLLSFGIVQSAKIEAVKFVKSNNDIKNFIGLLKNNKNLQEFAIIASNLNNEICKNILEQLKLFEFLGYVNLSECEFGNAIAEVIAELLRNKACKINRLNLKDAKFNAVTAETIFEAFEKNRSIEELDISGDDPERKFALSKLADALRENNNVKLNSIYLDRLFINEEVEIIIDDDEEEIEEAGTEEFDVLMKIISFRTITKASITGIKFTEVEMRHIAETIAVRSAFESLTIDCNYHSWEIESRIITYFARKLKGHKVEIKFEHPKYGKQMVEIFEKIRLS